MVALSTILITNPKLVAYLLIFSYEITKNQDKQIANNEPLPDSKRA